MNFAHLHLHTSKGSFLDSMVRIPDLMLKLNKFGHKFCAITDHGSMSGVFDFHQQCRKNNIVPILGCEFYEAQGLRADLEETYHLVLLAKNRQGYDNLVKLSTESNKVKFKNRGRIDDELLRMYSGGLICLSGCLSGRLAKNIINKTNIHETVDYYYQIFRDNYFFEIQDNGILEQEIVNKKIIELSKSTNIKIVITNDVHYLNRCDATSHDILKRIDYNKKVFSGFQGEEYFLKNVNDFPEKYQKYADVRCITNMITSYDIIDNVNYMPKIDNSKNIITEITTKKIKTFTNDQKYFDRLDYELKIINKMDYADYFLIVADFVNWCHDNDVVLSPGRGSACGSLVSYLLGITHFDPLFEGVELYFERFLNPDRISMPDIDVDVNDRDKVISYLESKYGKNNVCHIGTSATLQARDVLRSVCRVLGYKEFKIKGLLQELPLDLSNKSLVDIYNENVNFSKLINSDCVLKLIFDHAVKIEGCYKNSSIHASGVIISNTELNIPLNFNGKSFSQYDMHNIEKIGFIKFDILGLKTLDIIKKTLEKTKFDIKKIDLKNLDKDVLAFLCDGNTDCLFQWESAGYKTLFKTINPADFSELVDITCLYRPGTKESGLTEQYINRKLGLEDVVHYHPSLKSVLKRYGLPIFQEEVMALCNVIAGFTLGESDIVRKAIGKKDQKLLNDQKEKFLDGCLKNGIKYPDSISIWEKLEKFGRYSFNLSHSAAYTIVSVWTAYLSYYYPCEFFCSNLDLAKDKKEISKIMKIAIDRGVKIQSPDINVSEFTNVCKGNEIYLSFSMIDGISAKNAEIILQERKNGDFKDFLDFELRIPKSKCNKKIKCALVLAGAFDNIIQSVEDRKKILKYLDDKYSSLVDLPGFFCSEEKKVLGIYFQKTLIESLKLKIFEADFYVFEITSIRYHFDKKNKKMAFVEATDYKNNYNVIVFSSVFCKCADYLRIGNVVAALFDFSGESFIVKKIFPLFVENKVFVNNSFLPVVSSRTENSKKLTHSRYVMHENRGILYFCFENGTGEYCFDDIVGYKLK